MPNVSSHSLIHRFNVVPIRISVSYFVATNKQILFQVKEQKTQKAIATLKKKNEIRGLTSPKFKTFIKL